MKSFSYPGDVYNAIPPRVVFGAGSSEHVSEETRRLGASRVLVISTPGRGSTAEAVARRLGAQCVGVVAEAVSQVPIELAEQARKRATELKADCLVSVGGGASIGLGKAIALALGIPIIAIPTTYSGSEMTGFCGITIDGVKCMHTNLNMLAHTVIYDPALTVGLPLDVSAASAMNALAHCVDAIYVPTVSPIIAGAAALGAKVIADAILRVVEKPDDLDVRSEMLYGAYLAGAALTGGFALQHGLAHVLGGSFGVSHGLSHALILSHVATYNQKFAPVQVGLIGSSMGQADVGGAIFELVNALKLPKSLKEIGFQEKFIKAAAKITVETDNGFNPAPVTEEVVESILRSAFEGRRPD